MKCSSLNKIIIKCKQINNIQVCLFHRKIKMTRIVTEINNINWKRKIFFFYTLIGIMFIYLKSWYITIYMQNKLCILKPQIYLATIFHTNRIFVLFCISEDFKQIIHELFLFVCLHFFTIHNINLPGMVCLLRRVRMLFQYFCEFKPPLYPPPPKNCEPSLKFAVTVPRKTTIIII